MPQPRTNTNTVPPLTPESAPSGESTLLAQARAMGALQQECEALRAQQTNWANSRRMLMRQNRNLRQRIKSERTQCASVDVLTVRMVGQLEQSNDDLRSAMFQNLRMPVSPMEKN